MAAKNTGNALPPAEQLIRDLFYRIKMWRYADLLWDRVFSDQERRKLGTPAKAFETLGTIGMWQKVRGGSFDLALLNACRALGMIEEHNYQWLLREINERPVPVPKKNCPCWDERTGTLSFDGKTIRRVRVCRQPTNIQTILAAFEAQSWPPRLVNPLTLGPQQLHETLRFLNTGLKWIKFHSQEGGEAITWDRT